MNYEERRRKLTRHLSEEKVDLVAVSPGPDMLYLLGFYPKPDERPCYLFLTEDGESLVVPELNASQTAAHVNIPMTVYSDNDGPLTALSTVIGRLNVADAKKILVNGPMRADFALLLQEQIPGATLGTATHLLTGMRMRKDPEEIEALRINAEQADAAMVAAFAALTEGATELDIAREVEATFTAQGADSTNFAIIGSGPNSAFPHHSTSSQPILPNAPIVLDIGGTTLGYSGDLTRMAYVGTPSDEYETVHATVEAAVAAALAAVKPGAPGNAVDDAARGAIADAGYGEFFTHRTGHGIGLEGHEPPYMTSSNTVPLEEGMTFSIEPGVYLPGKFGVRLEEIVVVTGTGVEILSSLPRDLYRVSA